MLIQSYKKCYLKKFLDGFMLWSWIIRLCLWLCKNNGYYMDLFLRYNACTYGICNVYCLYAYKPWKVLDGLFNFGNECIDSFLKRFINDSLYIYIVIYKIITLVVSDTLEYVYSIYIYLNLLIWLVLL